jgi:ribosomal protein S18 acetylase RimI-like enzyme
MVPGSASKCSGPSVERSGLVGKATPAPWLRQAGPEDAPLFRALFAAGFAQELAYLAPAQREAFLELQWQARERDYRARYPGADDRVVVVDGVAAGRLLVARSEGELAIVDLAMLPEYRGQGTGSYLLGQLLEEAGQARALVRLYVALANPALNLYERFGFTRVAELGPYLCLEWRACTQR